MIVNYLISELAGWIGPIARYVVLAAGLQTYDDPGLPGGDPDLPETPLDGGVFVFILILLIYGIVRLRRARPAEI